MIRTPVLNTKLMRRRSLIWRNRHGRNTRTALAPFLRCAMRTSKQLVHSKTAPNSTLTVSALGMGNKRAADEQLQTQQPFQILLAWRDSTTIYPRKPSTSWVRWIRSSPRPNPCVDRELTPAPRVGYKEASGICMRQAGSRILQIPLTMADGDV